MKSISKYELVNIYGGYNDEDLEKHLEEHLLKGLPNFSLLPMKPPSVKPCYAINTTNSTSTLFSDGYRAIRRFFC